MIPLELSNPSIMGILNVTPDSFSDGGRYQSVEMSVEHGLQMARQGANIIDVGGESTRPGAVPVDEETELARTIPVIDLRVKFGLGAPASGDRSCIVVLDSDHAGQALSIGVAVDSVSEVLTIRSSQIDPTPTFGARIDTRHILAMAKAENGIRMLLDIDHVLQEDERLTRWVSPEDEACAA